MIDFDFHIHCAPYSTCATQTLDEAVGQAFKAGAKIIAICNHNNVDCLSEAKKACEKKNMLLVNGVELSVTLRGISDDLDGKVIHLLGYNFDLQNPLLSQFFKDRRDGYVKRILKICKYLRGKGYEVKDCESLKILRIQLADGGYFTDEKSAKNFLQSDEILKRFPKEEINPQEAIEFVHKIGGTVFLAHPNRAEGHFSLSKEQMTKIIDFLCGSGIDGLEVFHPDTVKEEGVVEYLLSITEERNLKVVLGSDTHHLLNQTEQYFIKNKQLKSYGFDFEKIKKFMGVKL